MGSAVAAAKRWAEHADRLCAQNVEQLGDDAISSQAAALTSIAWSLIALIDKERDS